MANVIVVGAQWGDEGKGPTEAPHVQPVIHRPFRIAFPAGSQHG